MRTLLILLAFALFCPSATAQKPEPKYKGKPLAYWVERLQKGETDKDQWEAAEALKAFGPEAESAVPTLIEMLNDRSYEYRWVVTQILCKIGPHAKEAVPELVKRLKEMQARKPQKEEEADHFIDMSNLIKILGSIGPDAKEAVHVLIALLSQSDSRVRDATLISLCKIGPHAKEAIPTIRRVVIDAVAIRDSSGSRPAFSSLEQFKLWENYDFELHKLGSDVVPLILEIFELPGAYGKRFALREMANLGPAAKKAVPNLIPFLQNDDSQLQFYTALVLWRIEKNAAVVPVLASLLTEDNAELVKAVVESLGEIGPDAKEALPALKAVLKDKSISMRSGLLISELQMQEAVKEAIQKISPSPKK